MTTLIISDLHLGSGIARTDLLAALLGGRFERLILNGDTVDDMNLRRFRPDHWRIIDQLRAIARDRELILLRGNHDDRAGTPALERLGEMLGARPQQEYELMVSGKRYLVLHGDQFDTTFNLTWMGDVTDWCYYLIQSTSSRLASWVKERCRGLNRVVSEVRGGAVAHARQRGFAGIITGHTHYSDDTHLDGIHFLNTGCWVDVPCSFIRADADGVRLHHWGPTALANAQPVPEMRRPSFGFALAGKLPAEGMCPREA